MKKVPGEHEDDPDGRDGPGHLPLVARALGPEVDEDDPQPVERVVEDRADEADLEEVDDRGLVRGDDEVVGLGGDPHERRVEHVHEEEEEDRDAGDAVEDPGPHALATAVQRADRQTGHAILPWNCPRTRACARRGVLLGQTVPRCARTRRDGIGAARPMLWVTDVSPAADRTAARHDGLDAMTPEDADGPGHPVRTPVRAGLRAGRPRGLGSGRRAGRAGRLPVHPGRLPDACTRAGRGPCASTPASAPPSSRTRATSSCSPPARRACRWPSTCRRRWATTRTTRSRTARWAR